MATISYRLVDSRVPPMTAGFGDPHDYERLAACRDRVYVVRSDGRDIGFVRSRHFIDHGSHGRSTQVYWQASLDGVQWAKSAQESRAWAMSALLRMRDARGLPR